MKTRSNFGVIGAAQSLTGGAFTGRVYGADDQMLARRRGSWASLFNPSLLVNVYNSSTSPSTGTFVVPTGATSIYVFAVSGGGGGGIGFYKDDGAGGGGGGAANLSGYKISVTAGETLSYSVGNGGRGRTTSDGSGTGYSGAATTISRAATAIFNLSGGSGGVDSGGVGGAGGLNNGYGISGGAGGRSGQRNGSASAPGTNVTNGCAGGGGGGGHLGNKSGSAGGISGVDVGTLEFGSITISFEGTSGGAAGTPYGSGDAPPGNVGLAYGGFGVGQDSNTGAGGGAGAGIKPTVNGTAAASFHGGGGGGNRSYITGHTPYMMVVVAADS